MTLRTARPILGVLLALVAAMVPAVAANASVTLSVTRGGPDATTTLNLASAGEVIVDLTVSAPGVSWATAGAESAVVSLSVDGVYQSDLVVMSDQPTARSVALGSRSAGAHTLSAHFAADRSPAGSASATITLDAVRVHTATDPAYAALANAPVVYGRQLKKASPFANATTDTPLLAWHEATAASTPGDTVLEYSVVWSNEDGGTASPALMARWGRTTDIEWIYRVEVDANGTPVAGTARVSRREPRDEAIRRHVRRRPSVAADLHVEQQHVRLEGHRPDAVRAGRRAEPRPDARPRIVDGREPMDVSGDGTGDAPRGPGREPERSHHTRDG